MTTVHADNDTCAAFHHEPGGTDLFTLGWCHGPPGLGWFFRQLEITEGSAEWRTWIRRAARADRTSGIPERREPGFWDNVARCCGSAGVAEFFLDLHRLEGRPDDLGFAVTIVDDLLDRSIVDDAGRRWSNYEYRQPGALPAPRNDLPAGGAGHRVHPAATSSPPRWGLLDGRLATRPVLDSAGRREPPTRSGPLRLICPPKPVWLWTTGKRGSTTATGLRAARKARRRIPRKRPTGPMRPSRSREPSRPSRPTGKSLSTRSTGSSQPTRGTSGSGLSGAPSRHHLRCTRGAGGAGFWLLVPPRQLRFN